MGALKIVNKKARVKTKRRLHGVTVYIHRAIGYIYTPQHLTMNSVRLELQVGTPYTCDRVTCTWTVSNYRVTTSIKHNNNNSCVALHPVRDQTTIKTTATTTKELTALYNTTMQTQYREQEKKKKKKKAFILTNAMNKYYAYIHTATLKS